MRRPPLAGPRPSAAAAAALLAVLVTGAAAPAEARGHRTKTKSSHGAKRAARSKITPNQEGKIAVFPVRYDDENAFSAQIERLLRAHGLEVATDVRRVDTAEQFRELSTALGFAAYVDGEYTEGAAKSRITIQVRNGYTGKRVALATFKESNIHLRAEVEDNLWTRIGPALARACADASKPRKRDRDPLMIEAGTPLADK
jgi:hypothetical protein